VEPENCIQCNFCSYVCPHAVIRPCLLTEEKPPMPEGTKIGYGGYARLTSLPWYLPPRLHRLRQLRNVCPGKKGEKALAMVAPREPDGEQAVFNKGVKVRLPPEVLAKFKETTVKGSQFKEPLLQFSGACAGCGETPYAKLVTQLFGDRMYIANATGCSSIWGGSAPSTPYTVNKGRPGPAGQTPCLRTTPSTATVCILAQNTIRRAAIERSRSPECSKQRKKTLKAAIKNYLDTVDCGANKAGHRKSWSLHLENSALRRLAKGDPQGAKIIWPRSRLDLWAETAGPTTSALAVLDHVIASGEDVNIWYFDTEVYSNTGGQSSKSTPTGAVAQFAAAGKEVKKKTWPLSP
jgi:pyruvate-ferredoxin/flavodoxin oxidoreductase